MSSNVIRKKIKDSKKELKDRFSVKRIGVFGSYSRGEQTKTSDVDILVEFYATPSLLAFVRLERRLSVLLGKKVDLVMKDALREHIGKQILSEVQYM